MSVAKLVKLLKVPVVTLNMKGNYLQSPIWNLTKRKEARLHTDMTYALTTEDIRQMTTEEIYDKLSELLSYDEYQWQRVSKMKISYVNRAKGLHLPLYQCRNCKTEFSMDSNGRRIYCTCCKAGWSMDEYGTLKSEQSNEEIYIPDWYEWQRENVREQIEQGAYILDMKVHVEALPNAKNFIDSGEGHLQHEKDGFKLTFTD